jgi:hypothetical protein
VFDFSGPNTPLNKQRNNVMLNTNDYDGVFFEIWTTPDEVKRCEVSSNFFVPGQWVHVVATVGGAGTTLFKNGVVAAVCEPMQDIPEALRDTNFIGRSSYQFCRFDPTNCGGCFENFDGTIASVRMYNQTLSASAVTKLYNATRAT